MDVQVERTTPTDSTKKATLEKWVKDREPFPVMSFELFRDIRSLRESPFYPASERCKPMQNLCIRCTIHPMNLSRRPRDSHASVLVAVFVIHAAVHVNWYVFLHPTTREILIRCLISRNNEILTRYKLNKEASFPIEKYLFRNIQRGNCVS